MKYSFVVVLCLGALVMQCSCRPQMSEDTTATSPAAEMTDAESPTDTTEQVVFDESQSGNLQSGDAPPSDQQQQEEESADSSTGGTTQLPQEPRVEAREDGETTIAPCSGNECTASAVEMEEEVVEANTESASSSPSETTSSDVDSSLVATGSQDEPQQDSEDATGTTPEPSSTKSE